MRIGEDLASDFKWNLLSLIKSKLLDAAQAARAQMLEALAMYSD